MDTMQRPGADRPPAPAARGRSSAFAGLLLIVFGALLLYERVTGQPLHLVGRVWGLAPIIIGLSHVSDRSADEHDRRARRRSGVWLMFIGAWGLANEFHLLGADYRSSWPALVIGVGLLIVWGALDTGRRAVREP